ncbi:molybdopterin oxidoreductase family protein [Sphingobium terrigena]|uniref:Molybdopterin oxidoreductase family protein n=1 Tax=Sphingobium terrigena TaxID=2304063 RepID=A0A418YL76_9SPHN|nr:molybdopterin oxidoreductase family protein [Sphingobium terrigena]
MASQTETVIGACPQDCPDTCSMIVSKENGKVISVRGNPDQPFTKGRLCVKVNNYQERVNSTDRILYPMRRTGPKGSGLFEQIGWNEALEEITTRWKEIAATSGPKAILPYSYLGTQGILNGLNVGDPFFNKLGATISERTFCDSGACTAYTMTIGHTAGVDPESFVHSRYIVLWASNTLTTNSHHWPFIDEARKRGAKIVVIDPYRTRTARLADLHVPIRPGTDGALALGIIHILFRDGLTDADYISQYSIGADELAERAAEYTPAMVADITGLSAELITELAHGIATSQPSVIRIGVAIERQSGGGQAVRAISCIPALVGSWRRPGGGLLQLPLWAFPVNWGAFIRPDFIGPEPRVLNQWKLGEALTDEMPLDPPIRSLMVYNANPMAMAPEQGRIAQGLAREDLFTVVSEHFLTDTARYADILLPATTQVEQEDIMFSWGHFYLSYNNRAIDPMGEAISNTELFRRLAKAMGFEDPCFSRTDEEQIAQAMLWDAPQMEGITVERLKREGFARLNLPSADEYAPHAQGNFATPSGKCEFKASMAAEGNFVLGLFRQGYDGQQSGEPIDPLPHYIAPQESRFTNPVLAARYPLNLITPKNHAFLSSSFGNLPHQRRHAGEQPVVMHPADAAKYGIAAGERVRVHNDRGTFEAIAQVTKDIRQGVVVAPAGHWASLNSGGATVHAVTSSRYADMGAAPTFSDTLVAVERC